MKRLAILGASGHGKVLADCAELGGWDTVRFFDDAWPQQQVNRHWPILGKTADLLQQVANFDGIVVAIGNNAIRAEKLKLLSDAGAVLPVICHPSASVSRYASLGPGSVVFASAVVNADCSVGVGAIINTGATVDHDCRLADAVHISPGAHLAGGVSVGARSWIGIGSCVRQQVRIGEGVVIGAGAAVVADVADASIVAGVPARSLRG